MKFRRNKKLEKIKAAVVGSTGYAGEELVRILSNHKNVELKFLTSRSYKGQNFQDVYSNFNKVLDINLIEDDIETLSNEVDVIFLALPHGIASSKVTKEILGKTKIIDLGADFRLKSKTVYEKWYNVEHLGENLLDEAVYGLPEIYREEIKKTNLIANPGCYTTCSILSLYPLFKNNLIETNSVIIDAKSGVTGAGRSVSLGVHFSETNENIKAYKIASHRHTPEIEQELTNAIKKDFLCAFTQPEISDLKFKSSFEQFANTWRKKYQWDLFLPLSQDDEYNFKTLHLPITGGQEEFDHLVLSLVKTMIDSLNEKEIVKQFKNPTDLRGGISKLEYWFSELNLSDYQQQIKFLRNLQELRSAGTGHRKGKGYKKIAEVFGLDTDNFVNVFDRILFQANAFILFLTKNFCQMSLNCISSGTFWRER